ncbi:cellulase family glycosylhydrolase [Rhodococcus kroppenstedtii]|uniref:cellulase family glycosylhydrolase n=1 Tax=Rhodococcoides kroppenstedtii TaxID=293050 RepID=UPI00295401E0|nr:cellulase family glycosylhydrolase [Rhodococcus kroppenstedtii]MDV7198339.1 cellulase family glycosylhydrolase [Rhodococcus kroppenstedtii]
MGEFSRRTVLTHAALAGVAVTGALALGRNESRQAILPAARSLSPVGFSAGSAILYMNDADQNQTLDALVATRATQIRFDIPWFFAQPSSTTFQWDFVDRVVDKARARNLSILAVLTSCPPWAALNQSSQPMTRPAQASTYASFAAAAARRYRGKISAYEIWNEPNGAMFFAPAPDATFYAAMVVAAYNAIKAVDSSLTVVAGAMGPVNDGTGTISANKFLATMYAAGVAGKFDALSFHPYENDATFAEASLYENSPARQMIGLHNTMKARGDGAKKIWLTEYGASTFDITADAQNALVTGSLRQWPEVSFAGPMYLYTVRDADSSLAESEAQFGAFTSTYQPKPLAYSIESYVRLGMPEREEGQVFDANADAALGKSVTPVFRISYGYGQEFELGSRFLSNGGFLSSPPAVAEVARRNGLVPITPFANDMQDFDKDTGFRVYSRPATTGTHVLVGSFITTWQPSMGFPVTDAYPVPGTQNWAVDCEFARMTYSPTTGMAVTPT